MGKLNEKQKLGAIAGGAVAICLLAGGGVWWAKGLIEEVRTSIEKKRGDIAAAEQKIAKIPATETEVIILRENLDEYVKILPGTADLNNFTKKLNQFQQQSGVQIVMFQPGRPSRNKAKAQRFEKIEYVYEMQATLWQFVRFINLIENYERFVAVTDFEIAENRGRDSDVRAGETVHGIKLTMETYTYNDTATGSGIEIPDYADKREMLREEIIKRMQMIRIDKYEHKGARGRRDIFVDPREREGRADGPPIEQQRAVFERHLVMLQELKDIQVQLKRKDLTIFDVFTLQKKLEEGVERLDISVQEVGSKMQITAPSLRLRWVKEVIEPLNELRQSGGAQRPRQQQDDPYLSAEDMQGLLDSMERHMEEGDLEGANDRFEAISPKLLVPENDPRHTLAVQAKALHLKVKTALEFRALEMDIQGVLVNHDGGRSGLLLNGDVYEEGEYISDDLMLRTVEEEQVWFVYRGLTLIRTL